MVESTLVRSLGSGQDVHELITAQFCHARGTGDLVEDSERCRESVRRDSQTGMNYFLKFIPNLVTKPERGDTPDNEDPLAKEEPNLLVVNKNLDVLNKFKLVLNKYPIVDNHSLIITNDFEWQSNNLNSYDLINSFNLLRKDRQNFNDIIIFNCGDKSGSSLNHKHLQLLTLPVDFVPFQDTLCLLEKKNNNSNNPKGLPLQDTNVPFANFIIPLPDHQNNNENESISEKSLYDSYLLLLKSLEKFNTNSYNLLMTKNWICVIPRSKIRSETIPTLGFNSIGYCGCIIIKDLSIFEKIDSNPNLLNKLLLETGFPQKI